MDDDHDEKKIRSERLSTIKEKTLSVFEKRLKEMLKQNDSIGKWVAVERKSMLRPSGLYSEGRS